MFTEYPKSFFKVFKNRILQKNEKWFLYGKKLILRNFLEILL